MKHIGVASVLVILLSISLFVFPGIVTTAGLRTTTPLPEADFWASPTTGVAPMSVVFIDVSSYVPGSWHWDFGDGTSSSLQNPIHTYTQPGLYSVTFTVNNSQGTDTVSRAGYICVLAGDSAWAGFRDMTYGYAVQYPAEWYAYPSSGSWGSVTTLSSWDWQDQELPSERAQIRIYVASKDRSPEVTLRDWVRPPSESELKEVISDEHPLFLSPDLVVVSYTSPEGTLRRAYVARGSKVYILELSPDVPKSYALFAAVVQSLTFTDPFERVQPYSVRYFGGEFHALLPLLLSGGGPSGVAFIAKSSVGTALSYRLPFVGTAGISQGPGTSECHYELGENRPECGWTHCGPDREAIDFVLPYGTDVYAAEEGVATIHPDPDEIPYYGLHVTILHPDGRVSWYVHLSEISIPNGPVSREALIGKVGNTGTDATHLHFMVQQPHTRSTDPLVRSLPGVTWYSPNAGNTCNDVTARSCMFGSHPVGCGEHDNYCYCNDGSATGPAIGNERTCAAPVLTSPEDRHVFDTAVLSFSWNGQPCITNGYILRLNTVADMESGVHQDFACKDSQWSGALPAQYWNSDLYWSVRAANTTSVDWAPARRFRVSSPAPACSAPLLHLPPDGATLDPRSVIFRWKDGSSCSGNGYDLRVKTVPNMDVGGETILDISSGIMQYEYAPDPKWLDRALYWSVKRNVPEAPWAPAWRFGIASHYPLQAPYLTTPANNSHWPQDTNITLGWDSVSGAVKYRVEFWGGAYSRHMAPCGWQSGTTCRIGRLSPGTISWHVRACDAEGNESDWSDTWNLVVTSPAQSVPGAPQLLEPAHGAQIPVGQNVVARWSVVAEATMYKVDLWSHAGGQFLSRTWQAGTSANLGPLPLGAYAWRVKARNAAGQEGSWSGFRSFHMVSSTPTATPTRSTTAVITTTPTRTNTLMASITPTRSSTPAQTATPTPTKTLAPSNTPSSIGAPVLSEPPNGATIARGTTYRMCWNSVAGANEYWVEVQENHTYFFDWHNSGWIGGTCFERDAGDVNKVYWKVKARNAAGESDWSAQWVFYISTS